MIVSIEDFRNEAKIAGLLPVITEAPEDYQNKAIQFEVLQYIEKYEPLFLDTLLGDEVASDLTAYSGLRAEAQTCQEYNELIEAIRIPCAYYISYWYHRSRIPVNTTIGGVEMQGENGIRAGSSARLTKIWNDMCYLLHRAGYRFKNSELLHHINNFNL
ncbi:MAG: hypothetical protein LBL18_03395 [Bacteroidales bacterium]|nr:hypothetical protein [Bacteroidales bacterium]